MEVRKEIMDIVESQAMKDKYFSQDECVKRLLREWEKYGRLVVAYDFDSTVCPKEGEDPADSCDQMIELLRECKKAGCSMIVFTARPYEEYDIVKKFLEDNSIPYDYINENDPMVNLSNARKIFYNIFFDDRCALAATYEIMVRTLDAKMRGDTI